MTLITYKNTLEDINSHHYQPITHLIHFTQDGKGRAQLASLGNDGVLRTWRHHEELEPLQSLPLRNVAPYRKRNKILTPTAISRVKLQDDGGPGLAVATMNKSIIV